MTAAPVIDDVIDGEVEDQDPEYAQPSELVDEATIGAEVSIAAGQFGALTLRPDQKRLDDDQKAALSAIGIDVVKDPGVKAHILPFIHLCQIRGLDPYAQEAHLIGRGQGDWRRWTMQVGIGGYLKMAKRTGQYIGIADRLWTPADDDEKSWRAVDDGHGGIIMRRVWWDAWADERTDHPGQAKVLVDYYDDERQRAQQGAVADWRMFAPMTPKYTGKGRDRRKVVGPDGKDVLELGEFWRKGGAHMLAKCATALSLRLAFPAQLNGVYTHEEMHQADARAKARIDAERAAERHRVVMDLRAGRGDRTAIAEGEPAESPAPCERPVTPAGPVDDIEDDLINGSVSAPMQLGDIMQTAMKSQPKAATGWKGGTSGEEMLAKVAQDQLVDATVPGAAQAREEINARLAEEPVDAEVVEPASAQADAATRRGYLVEELEFIAEVMGTNVRKVAQRWMLTHRKDLDAFTADELQPLVAGLRPMVARKLRTAGREGEAEVYENIPAEACGPRAALTGTATRR